MKHKIWKVSFVVALCATLLWSLETIGGAILYWNDPILFGRQAAVFCLLLGMATVPVMGLLTAYLARQAFRDVKERG